MDPRATLLRGALLFGPVMLALAAAVWRKPTRREWGGALVASVWTFVSLVALNLWAEAVGLWSFGAVGGTHRGIPVDVLIGWTALWGLAFPVAFGRAPLIASLFAAFWLDALTMPAAAPIVLLETGWWWGEVAVLAVGFLPAQLAFRWTRDDRRLTLRATMQVIAFGALTFWFLGDVATVATYVPGVVLPFDWWMTPSRPTWLTFVALGCAVSLFAVHEFVARGVGTPIPWDPPKQLVTSGLYRYIRNPMQLGMWIALPAWGLAYGNLLLCAAGIVSVAFSLGLAQWHESEEFLSRFGGRGAAYRAAVRWGAPRLLPHVSTPAKLFYGGGCDVCEPVARWISHQDPIGLELISAQNHSDRDLERLTYRHPDGAEEDGIAALARAFEHMNVAWALLGCSIRLPIVRPLLQLIVDVSGGGPRLIPRESGAVCQASGITPRTAVSSHQAPTSKMAPGITNRSQ